MTVIITREKTEMKTSSAFSLSLRVLRAMLFRA
jgi:hypothetical protein